VPEAGVLDTDMLYRMQIALSHVAPEKRISVSRPCCVTSTPSKISTLDH
jgi:hypothetical protein